MSHRMYLIWCRFGSVPTGDDRPPNEHVLWWKPSRAGYTRDVNEAGRYTEEEARSIERIRGLDTAVPEDDIGVKIKVRKLVEVTDMPETCIVVNCYRLAEKQHWCKDHHHQLEVGRE